ncbi:hypothetical protein BM613_05045 [Sulfoacidibacillus thermotolerans]|uniref:Uncharacterized protein n=1 Tax=Sulfoacidibacillus thermotolerans TaxID=1765684 RepID=A0A2U3D9V2_SULT2|nr:hypothetical protein BM613_05045 [Sulfoacidibacillus thermotolerans]
MIDSNQDDQSPLEDPRARKLIKGLREEKYIVYSLDETKLDRIPLVHYEDNEFLGGNENED